MDRSLTPPPSRKPQLTLTVTALLVLPWNTGEPRYWASNVNWPRPKNATVNVASATPLTTRTVARAEESAVDDQIHSAVRLYRAGRGVITTVKVTVGGLFGRCGFTWPESVVVVPMSAVGGGGKIDSNWSLRSATSCTR